jgi:hypothetical protein
MRDQLDQLEFENMELRDQVRRLNATSKGKQRYSDGHQNGSPGRPSVPKGRGVLFAQLHIIEDWSRPVPVLRQACYSTIGWRTILCYRPYETFGRRLRTTTPTSIRGRRPATANTISRFESPGTVHVRMWDMSQRRDRVHGLQLRAVRTPILSRLCPPLCQIEDRGAPLPDCLSDVHHIQGYLSAWQ